MYEGVDTVILHNELACEDVLPVAWRALAQPLDDVALAALTDRNVQTLQVALAIEEHGSVEKPDDKSPHAADLMRLEVKVNLLVDLMGQLLAASQKRPKPSAIRFNALGAVWHSLAAPATGQQGLLDIYLRDCLAQPITLIGRVMKVSTDGQVRINFTPPGEMTSDLLEKLAFRRHRRQVAGVRQPRRAGSETGITRILG
jgi:hypothetical protein